MREEGTGLGFAQAYRTWLGFYKTFLSKLGWKAERLVQEATHYSSIVGEIRVLV